ALLTAALGERGANILGLSVQLDTEGVVDEFVVDVPRGGPGARELAETLGAAGGARTAVRPACPQELVDEPVRALVLAARLRAEPHAVPEVLAELLRADDASWTAPREGLGGSAGDTRDTGRTDDADDADDPLGAEPNDPQR